MFSENKLNVATSRAASQQVLIVNANLVNRDSLQKLKDFATSQDDEVSKRILGEYPIKYLEKLAEYVRYAGDGICVLNVK